MDLDTFTLPDDDPLLVGEVQGSMQNKMKKNQTTKGTWAKTHSKFYTENGLQWTTSPLPPEELALHAGYMLLTERELDIVAFHCRMLERDGINPLAHGEPVDCHCDVSQDWAWEQHEPHQISLNLNEA